MILDSCGCSYKMGVLFWDPFLRDRISLSPHSELPFLARRGSGSRRGRRTVALAGRAIFGDPLNVWRASPELLGVARTAGIFCEILRVW